MAPHNRGSLENIPLNHEERGPVLQQGGNSGEQCLEPPEPPVEMVEQPLEESRFRYSRESRTNGSILGVHSTDAVRTYPTVRVNYSGRVKIRVSCVNKNAPHRPHPHLIVGRDCDSRSGVCTRFETITENNRNVQLMNIGIQCTKREHIARALQNRGIDPFGVGYDNPNVYTSKMLHYVRLAIEVFIPDDEGNLTRLLGAVVTDVITDLPTKMHIYSMTPRHGSAYGETRVTMLTNKLPCNDVTVRFEDESSDWKADVRPVTVHNLVSLVVETPPYTNPHIHNAVSVRVRLLRPATGDPDIDKHMLGEPSTFIYMPGPNIDLDSVLAPKRQRTEDKVLIQPLQDLNYLPNTNAPPEPQPSTSGLNLGNNTFQELDKWYFNYVDTPSNVNTPLNSVDKTVLPQPSLQMPLPRHVEAQNSYNHRQVEHRQIQEASVTVPVPTETILRRQKSPLRCQESTNGQFTTPANHGGSNVMDSLLLDEIRFLFEHQVEQRVTPAEPTLKRTHSQMSGSNPRPVLVRAQYSQTDQTQPSCRNSSSFSIPSNASSEVQIEPAWNQFGSHENRSSNEFLEIPPNQIAFHSEILMPEIVHTTHLPLIDLTGQENVVHQIEDPRYYNQLPIWQMDSRETREYQENVQLQPDHGILPVADRSSEDAILSLSDEFADFDII